MHGSQNFTLGRVREILQLAEAIRSSRDSLTRKRLLLEGICRLVRGSSASCEVGALDQTSHKASVLSVVRVGGDDGNSQWLKQTDQPNRGEETNDRASQIPSILTAPAKRPAARLRSSHRAGGGIVSTINFKGVGLSARIRVWCDRPRFSATERTIVDLVLLEMSWVFEDDLLAASRKEISLSPRQRQTLDHLLSGDSEKQIAAKLQLSQNTVHHYVKALHRHFDVSSRSELLAKWVKR